MLKPDVRTSPNPWLLAIRPRTLPAAAAPVVVGTALALAEGKIQPWTALACLLAAVSLQIGSNLANDVFDYEKGTDSGVRLGPTRVTQAGLLTPSQVKGGMWGIFGFTVFLGSYLILKGGWPILFIGVAAIFSAIAYTGGPFPFGYYGLGDLFVFVFFGLAATAGTYYVQVGMVSPAVWWMAAAMGFLTVAILVVNNLRDIDSDRRANKRTLAVRLGERKTRFEYILLMIFAYGVPLLVWIYDLSPPWVMLTWMTIPKAVHWVRYIHANTGSKLNQALAGTGQLELLYGLLFSLGMVISVI